jgi:hypothetical protein
MVRADRDGERGTEGTGRRGRTKRSEGRVPTCPDEEGWDVWPCPESTPRDEERSWWSEWELGRRGGEVTPMIVIETEMGRVTC